MQPEAIDEVTTKRLQHTKNDASTVARPGTLKKAKQERLGAIKRKADHDLEDGPKKRAKTGPGTASPLRELKKFPKTPQKAVEPPAVKEAEAGAQSKKRQREDDAEFVGSKRAKVRHRRVV